MKLNKKWLLIILGILVIFNVSIFLINHNVSGNVTFTYVYSNDKDPVAKQFMELVQKDDNANKVHFAIIGPDNKNYKKITEQYDLKNSTNLLIFDSNNKLINRVSGPDAKKINSEFDKYVN